MNAFIDKMHLTISILERKNAQKRPRLCSVGVPLLLSKALDQNSLLFSNISILKKPYKLHIYINIY